MGRLYAPADTISVGVCPFFKLCLNKEIQVGVTTVFLVLVKAPRVEVGFLLVQLAIALVETLAPASAVEALVPQAGGFLPSGASKKGGGHNF